MYKKVSKFRYNLLTFLKLLNLEFNYEKFYREDKKFFP